MVVAFVTGETSTEITATTSFKCRGRPVGPNGPSRLPRWSVFVAEIRAFQSNKSGYYPWGIAIPIENLRFLGCRDIQAFWAAGWIGYLQACSGQQMHEEHFTSNQRQMNGSELNLPLPAHVCHMCACIYCPAQVL
jgi:hypothetical protein